MSQAGKASVLAAVLRDLGSRAFGGAESRKKVSKADHALRPVAYWRERAEESYILADDMSDGFAKDSMLEIAEMYERLADQAAAIESRNR
jgi:hypothetical protein